MTTWILVADASEAKLFELTKERTLRAIESFHHPESRAKGSDLLTDRMGGFEERGESAGDLEGGRFVIQLRDYLERGHTTPGFQRLVLVGPPAFLGMLRARLSPPVQKTIFDTLSKDYVHLKDREIAERLGEQIPL